MIKLRLIKKSEVPYIEHWLNDDRTLRLMARCNTREFDGADEDNYFSKDKTFTYIIWDNDEPIGYARLTHYTVPIMDIGIVIADIKNRHKGIGTEVYKILKDNAWLIGATKLTWITADYNIPSQHIAEKLGFKIQQVMNRAIYIDGKVYNMIKYEREI